MAVEPASAIPQQPEGTAAQVDQATSTAQGFADQRQLLVQQLAAASQAGSTPGRPSQELLLASQAAELASARQAMQLLAQLLESLPQPAEQVGGSRQAADTLQGLLSQLLHSQQSDIAPQGPSEDVSALLTAQAAELASARQAMQPMAQLLEQRASTDESGREAASAEVQQKLAGVLQQLSMQALPEPALRSEDQVCNYKLQSLTRVSWQMDAQPQDIDSE